MTDDTPIQAASQFLILARRIDAECQKWLPQFIATNYLDMKALRRMEVLRQELACSKPVNALDALILVGALQTVASFIHAASNAETHEPAAALNIITSGSSELLLALSNVATYLEEACGQSLESLGIFNTEQSLQ